ncbi:hypothetical protein VMUT_1758 [Vulcanisaeta moutnovskia 768-28]|uniref:Uncharacterized protein n=1 Tax=Vulcanisaeta moutnovskia (strain 768-28) TaxID=985053 RepID=F0QUX7_VULM7|nr:hypothetical protein [Vulcanisaeta moutnovskia]ADY01959.1 hypothetical protein VMUT_1758 [Vulcanisaeta moutnovskia 768-28]
MYYRNNTRRINRQKRGDLSGPIYTILMIVFVIVAAIMLYNYFQSRTSVLTTQAQISIVNPQLAGNVYSITVENIGTTPVTITSISIYSQNSQTPVITQTIDTELNPGQSTSIVGTSSTQFITGNKYIVVIEGHTDGGQEVAAESIAISQ